MSRRPYKPKMPRAWFLENPFYTAYIIREATSIFIGLWSLNLLLGLLALTRGENSWQSWIALQTNPLMMVFSVITFCMAMYHTATWFATVPKTLPLVIGGRRVQSKPIILVHWVLFFSISLIILSISMWGVQ